jgi:MSHA biogenesis protein MshM
MYLEHYGLSEPPFRITPHTDFFFSGANRGATLEALLYAITHDEGIVKISGEVGSGKTMLCRVLMERLPENVVIIYLANPSLSREDILYALADELGIETPENTRASAVMRALQEKLLALYADSRQVVVLIDEAHAMPKETLEEIRLLSNLESNRHKLLQLVLFGQPELNETLARADMRQLRERITQSFRLEPLVRDDIAEYLDFRMRAAGYRGPSVFSPEALKLIDQASQGLTRRINILADKALLASYANGTHQVSTKEAREAIKDAEFTDSAPGPRKTAKLPPTGLVWAAGGAIVMLVAMVLFQRFTMPAAAPSPAQATAASGDAAVQASTANPPPPAPAETANTALPPLQVAPALPPPPAEVAPAPVPERKPPPQGSATPLLDKLLADSRPWLDSVADNRWFLQLFTTDGVGPEQAELFLARARTLAVELPHLRAYHAKIGTINRYGVVYGDYASRKDAVNALDDLPASLKQNRPYARQAIRLRLNNNS